MNKTEGAIKTVIFWGIMLHNLVEGLLGQYQISQRKCLLKVCSPSGANVTGSAYIL
jgi:hypothetical protein